MPLNKLASCILAGGTLHFSSVKLFQAELSFRENARASYSLPLLTADAILRASRSRAGWAISAGQEMSILLAEHDTELAGITFG